MKKQIISALVTVSTILASFAGCSVNVTPPEENSVVTVTSSALTSYGNWLENRLKSDGIPSTDVIIGDTTTADEYGVDLSEFVCDEGYIIRRETANDAVLIFGTNGESVDMAVRYYANYCDKEAALNVVEGESYRVGSITISGHDLSEFVIVCPADADSCHRYAATELQRFLEEACGIRPEIVTESDGFAISLICDKTGETYGDEAFNIKSHEKGITITGGRYRGCMYGAYTFLEKFIGYRFYYDNLYSAGTGADVGAATAYLYKSDAVVIENADHTEYPSIHARDSHGDGTSSVALKFNGMRQWYYGGTGIIVKACHGYSQWIPDWELKEMGYEVGYEYGKQPCFTDEYLNELLVSRIVESCERTVASGGNPSGTVDIAQHDCGDFCMCDSCVKVYAETESIAGAVVLLANMVAEALEPYPDVVVAILAYYGTDIPPKNIEVHEKVYVSYCFYVTLPKYGKFVCGNHSISGTECADNKYFAEKFDGWADLTENLYVWYYPFQAYHLAYSSTYTNNIYHDIKYLAEKGTYGIFFHASGAAQTYGPLLIDFYMGQRMMWDATISEEEYQDMLKEFLYLAYGDGGDAVYEYIQILEEAANNKNCFCGFHACIPDKLDFNYLKQNMGYLVELRENAIRFARTSLQEELCEKIFKSVLYYQLVVSHTDMWKNGDDASRAEYKALVDNFLTNHRDLPLGEYGLGNPAYAPTIDEVNYDDQPLTWIHDGRGSWNGNNYSY